MQAGDLIGRCGNAGGTSEPHLHVGISRRDSEGFLRSLPMTLSKIKNGSGQAVSGVPADNDFYSSSATLRSLGGSAALPVAPSRKNAHAGSRVARRPRVRTRTAFAEGGA